MNTAMKELNRLLPATIECPHCNAMLELDEKEREDKKVVCPECKTTIDFNTSPDWQTRLSTVSQPFRQSRLIFDTRELTLKDNEVLVKETTPLTKRSFSVPFEVIPNDYVEVSVSSQWALMFLSVTGVVAVSKFLAGEGESYLLMVLPVGIWYWLSRVTYLVYHCGDLTFTLFKNLPSEEVVRNFVDDLNNQRQKYLRATYIGTNTGGLVDELYKLAWLKDKEALTGDEYDRIKVSLLDEIKKSKSKIGFTDD